MCEHKPRYLLSICSATFWTKESSSLFSLWEYTLWILITLLTFSVAPVCTQCRMSEKWKTVETQVSCARPTYIWKHIPPDDLVAAISVFLQSTGKPDNRTSFTYTSGYDGIKYILWRTVNKNNFFWTQFMQDFMFFMLTACGKVLVEERLQE